MIGSLDLKITKFGLAPRLLPLATARFWPRRLLEQSLYELGFADLASALEKRSGVTRATRDAEAFERAVLDGRWDDAVARLPKTAQFAEARLVCLECLYEDQIRGGAYDAALATLQKRVAPLFDLSGERENEKKTRLERNPRASSATATVCAGWPYTKA